MHKKISKVYRLVIKLLDRRPTYERGFAFTKDLSREILYPSFILHAIYYMFFFFSIFAIFRKLKTKSLILLRELLCVFHPVRER